MEGLTNTHESAPKIITVAPAIESLMNLGERASAWPEEIIHNPELIERVRERIELRKSLDVVFQTIPDATLEISRAVDIGLLETEVAKVVYDRLIDLLKSENTERLVLYIPFEMIPGTDWHSEDPVLAASVNNFINTYMSKWRQMLRVKDVRANFVDGDILENQSRIGDHDRVVKAIHLIPKLVEKGLISSAELLELKKYSDDETFLDSLNDAYATLDDIGLLPAGIEVQPPRQKEEQSLPITPNREAWLIKEKNRILIDESSDTLAYKIEIGDLKLSELEERMLSLSPIQNTLIGIHAIRKTVETTKSKDLQQTYESLLTKLWNSNNPEVQDALTSTWSRWLALEIIDVNYVDQFNIKLPKLDGSFEENKDRMKSDIETAEELAQKIETDPLLSQHVYPVTLLYGSRVKGYNTKAADRDLAVFIKPNITDEVLPEVQSRLEQLAGGAIFEFKTMEDENGLHLAEKVDSTYVLFQSVWSGDQSVIKELHEKILAPYLYSSENRKPWLEEIERNIIQYRLLHRGYTTFFPPQGGIGTKNSDRLDENSMFWDSGFRRVATKLFVSKVFLPHLEK